MNLHNLDTFLVFAKDFDGVFQIIIAAIIIIASIISSKKAADKKKKEQEKKRQQKTVNAPPSHTQTRAPAQDKPQGAKFWGVRLDKVEEDVDFNENYDDDDFDDDDYDPLEPRPAKRSFAHKIKEPTRAAEEELGYLENKHLTSKIEQEEFHSNIENQNIESQFSTLDFLSEDFGSVSAAVEEEEDTDVSIEISVPKGSPEAFVHAVVLGEIFGPPMCMREPYALKDDEETFKKSTLL